MFNNRIIQSVIIFSIGVFLAIWLGLSLVTDQTQTIIKIIAAILFVVCFLLGKRIWLLIPFAASLAIGLRIPGQPDALLLAQIAFIAFSIPQFLLRKLPWRLEFTELEFWILMISIMFAQVYMRNPVGVNIFGGDTVGGKGYVLYAIALASALILCGQRIPASDLKWFMRLSIAGGLLNLAISIMGVLVPAIGFYTGQIYTRSDEVNFENREAVDTRAASRIGFLTELGKNLSLYISSYISPLSALMKPLWFILILATIAAALMGGYRTGIIATIMTFIVGIAYRSGGVGLLLSSFMGIGGIALLAVINLIAPLPPNAQRALTFLPGTWEQRYKDDAHGSTDWRVEIWKEALSSERWIKNKWLGDGLGFSAAELAAQMNRDKLKGLSGFDAHVEAVLVNGDYHSGPVSSIRIVGYIGLLVFLVASIRLAIHSHHQILRCRGSEWFPLAMFIGIPMIFGPLIFVFVFGDFKKAGPAFLLSCAMVRLLENNLPLPAYVKRRRGPFILQNGNRALARMN